MCAKHGNSNVWIGYVGAIIAILLFGSNYTPVKKFDTGDGMRSLIFAKSLSVRLTLLWYIYSHLCKCGGTAVQTTVYDALSSTRIANNYCIHAMIYYKYKEGPKDNKETQYSSPSPF